MPPAIEICVCPLAAGNGRTYTSNLPDSSDAYATHRAFGEKRLWISLNGVPRNVLDVRSPANVNTRRSYPRGVACSDRRNRPSPDTSLGYVAFAARTSSTAVSSCTPPTAFWKIAVVPDRLDPKSRRPPSADQTGNQSARGSDVRREVVRRASPNTQRSGCAAAGSV